MNGYFFSIFLSTFVLEDVALASSIGLVSSGKLDFANAFMACFLGIAIGDLGLYLVGYLAPLSFRARFPGQDFLPI
jgi:membrane protein DedA with SNARE-associated domain